MSAPESWPPGHSSSAEQPSQGPSAPPPQMAQAGPPPPPPPQGSHRPPAMPYQTQVQGGQAGPVLPPPSTLPAGPAGYYQTQQHPIPLPVMPPHGREPYPMGGPLGPNQANRASLPPQPPSAGDAGPPQQPVAQGQTAPPTGLPQGMPPQNQLAPGPIPPQPTQVPQPVHPQASPPMARTQPQMAASAGSAHHSLAALAGPQVVRQVVGQGAGPAMNAAQAQAQQVAAGNGPAGPILNDALSYLDQVKFQFHDRPDVYNQFLDIMKDFKSQAIDTPGVIKRVSTLFSGHPNLVQGFNTFLPPGFIISCSNDPMDNSIRVTTPQGTTTNQATGPPRQMPGARDVAQFYDNMPRGAKGWPNGPEQMYPPGAAFVNQPGPPGPDRMHHDARMRDIQQNEQARAQAVAQAQHQAQHQASVQVAVNQLQAAAATNGGPRSGPMGPGAVVQNAAAERQNPKGPVEFNHAISYVNKIKNRFASQPEIYKNFLEILQTYQREQKPIQDVYSQVTELFKSAPDLLEEFKQFLPESAAQAKAAAAAKAAAEQEAAQNSMNQGIMGGPTRLPPVGNFAPPPSASKEKKKRTQINGAEAQRDFAPSAQANRGGASQHNKAPAQRSKVAPKPTETAPLSPSLAPARPEPYLPVNNAQPSTEDIAFFDRAKKFIGNKQTYNEFLKLLNLFTQELIDKNTLVNKVDNFIGNNKDLMEWFKKFVGYDGEDTTINNLPTTLNKVRLSVCRAYGPSYRLLPRAESQKPCSGRDEMCREVLNDDWASHPTWASEDSGFVAHRKNQYEDVLHRIEEERHDYDFNIEANLRTIQLLEPIAQKIANLTEEEKKNFRLQPGLEGQSKTIYKRVIKKIYEKDRGNEVIEQMHANPCVVVPIVLRRLKQKDEEWKMAQREWNKVWREQTSKAFWKSLDHHGLSVKISDRKNYMLKNLISEIQTKHKEQMLKRINPLSPSEYQYVYRMDDYEVLFDAVKLLIVALDHSNAHSAADKDKMEGFIHSFIPLFFGIPPKDFDEHFASTSRGTPDEDGDLEQAARRRPHLQQRGDENLLKSVFRRKTGRGHYRRDKEGSVASGSKESTPEVHSGADEDTNMEGSEPDTNSTIVTWIRPPKRYISGESKGRSPSPNLPQRREIYSLFCNNQTYGFFRTFHLVYSRLLDIKKCEDVVAKDIEIRKQAHIAKNLGILLSTPEDFFRNTEPGANYYKQVIEMCEQFILGEIESSTFEDGLRQVYIQKGWQLYTIDKLLAAILKFIHVIVNSEKTGDSILLFQKDRQRKEFNQAKTEYMTLIAYRNRVESLFSPEEPLLKIDWNETSRDICFQLLTKNDSTTASSTALTPEQKWNHYMQSYTMTIPTEGVSDTRLPFLKRTIPRAPETAGTTPAMTPANIASRASTPASADPSSSTAPTAKDHLTIPNTTSKPTETSKDSPYFWTRDFHDHPGGGDLSIENMEVKICVNSYKMFFSSYDILIRSRAVRRETPQEVVKARKERYERWLAKVAPTPAGNEEGEVVMGDAEEKPEEEQEVDGDDTVLVEKEGEKDGDVEMSG